MDESGPSALLRYKAQIAIVQKKARRGTPAIHANVRGCSLTHVRSTTGAATGDAAAAIAVGVASTGEMNRYPRLATVSMKRGLSAESRSASRSLATALFSP